MIKRSVLVFMLAACGGSPKPAPAPAPEPAPAPVKTEPAATPVAGDCTGAVNNTMAVSADQLKDQPKLLKVVPEITSTMIKHCNDDKWSGATIQCMTTGKTGDEQEKCQNMLTPDQAQKVTADLQALIQTAMSK